MLNHTTNITNTIEETYRESYSDDNGESIRIFFLMLIIIVGSFTILAAIKIFTNRK
jgi:hypothetical protein